MRSWNTAKKMAAARGRRYNSRFKVNTWNKRGTKKRK